MPCERKQQASGHLTPVWGGLSAPAAQPGAWRVGWGCREGFCAYGQALDLAFVGRLPADSEKRTSIFPATSVGTWNQSLPILLVSPTAEGAGL